jgi:hypothetical protein
MKKETLSAQEALHAIRHGEFSPEVICSNKKVAVIMTQDWCPQWKSMCEWLHLTKDDPDLHLYEMIYNQIDCFEQFLDLKENRWRNSQIPYVRYYVDGKLVCESNYAALETFLSNLRQPAE